MKCKAFTAVFTAALLVFGNCTANALTLTCVFNPEKNELDISGTSDSDIFAIITEHGANLSELYDNSPLEADQISSDKGKYNKTFSLINGETGKKYDIFVSDRNGGKKQSTILMYDLAEAKKIYTEKFKDINSFDEFCTLFEDNAIKLGIDIEEANYISHKEKILKYLFYLKSTDYENFRENYDKALCFALLNTEKTLSVLEDNENILGINFKDDFSENEKLTESIKKAVVSEISEYDFEELCKENKDFSVFFAEVCCKCSVNESNSWIELKKIITEDYAALFRNALESEEYTKIKISDDVYKTMMKLPRGEFSEIQASLYKAIKNVYKAEKKSASSSSSGSNGGSGSGGGYIGGTFEEVKNDDEKVFFSDLSLSHWSYNAVLSLYSKGIISGYEDGSIKPDNEISRAEFVKLITQSISESKSAESKNTFTDVSRDDWFYDFILKAYNEKLIFGSNGKFRPKDSITREDAAVILCRALENKNFTLTDEKKFKDCENISDYAKKSVALLYAAEIISGSGDEIFEPQRNISRAEAFQLIYNTLMKTER